MRSILSLSCLVLLAAVNACGNSPSDQGSVDAAGGAYTDDGTSSSGGQNAATSKNSQGGASAAGASKKASTGGASASKSSVSASGGSKGSVTDSNGDDAGAGGSSELVTKAIGGAKATGGSPSTANGKATGGTSSSSASKATGGTSSSSASKATGGVSQGGSSSRPPQSSSAAGGNGTTTTSVGGQTGTGGSSPQISEECTDSSTDSGTFTTRYDAGQIKVTGKQKSYVIHTNWWYKYTSQTVTYNGLSMKIGDSAKTAVSASEGAPTGFPSIFIGSYTGNTSEGSNLPKQVSALKSVPTILSTDASAHDTSNYNATYDVWLTAASSPLPEAASDPGGDGALLMVWLYKPSGRQPRGGKCSANGCTPDQPNHTVAGVSQSTWDVWLGPGGGGRAPCVSYVSTQPLDSLSFDLNKFIQDAVANNYFVKSSMYLSIVFGGLEIWGGGDGVQITKYCAQVN
ncbi:MAG TPA: hypothetical protein VKP30_31580 [Polyangiaceae bacterium]|nr:hypothetical protein [Polyangiaceae bacterium]